MASHRMPESDRPRRPVPAWVTAPPSDGLEARPTPATSAPVERAVGPDAARSGSVSAVSATAVADLVVPDFPPEEHLLPPAPTSPAVHSLPFDRVVGGEVSSAPAPTSPVDAAPRPQHPAVPTVGQPRFSVPGLEHVVVEGTEPEPTGPVGYRTPARFAQHQAQRVPTAAAVAPVAVAEAAPPTAPVAAATSTARTEPILQAGAAEADASRTDGAARPRLGVTPGAVLGAVTGIATLGLAAWWFTAPATVHGVGVVLGVLALALSVATLRNPAATWQRPVAMLGAVLGGVGTVVLLWAVASALLATAGVTLPDLTGSGTVPTLAP